MSRTPKDQGEVRIRVAIYSEGKRDVFWVRGESRAARAGSYSGSVGYALAINDPAPLKPFVGGGIVDVSGKLHRFETDLATLYRLDAQGALPWDTAYQRVG